MLTPEQPLTELIASDEYWQGPHYNPYAGQHFIEAWAGGGEEYNIARDVEKAQEIGRLVISMRGGGTIESIPEGEEILPASPDSRKVIMAVQDSRTITPRYLPTAGHLKHQRPCLEDETYRDEVFNNTASIMANGLYLGEAVSRIIPINSTQRIYIQREVLYMRPTHEGDRHSAIDSSHIEDNSRAAAAFTLPVLKVGSIYKDDMMWRKRSSKIVAASVLEPHGVAWTPHDYDNEVPLVQKHRRLVRVPGLSAG